MDAFSQDQEFWYLTGVAEPGVAILLFPKTGRQVLFVPPFSRFTATWDGDRLAPGEASAAETGFDVVANIRTLVKQNLVEALAKVADGKRRMLWTILSPTPNRTATSGSASGAARRIAADPLDGRPSREDQLKSRLTEMFDGLEVRDLTPAVNRLRGVKTADEIAQIRASSQAAAQGIAEAMKSTEPGMYEYQVAAVAGYVFSRLGAGPDAYAAIFGGGPNGCVLHYSANPRQLTPDDLVVMDNAPAVNGYASDVTRTFPASGRFSAAQRDLVTNVHEVQQALIRAVKPGASLVELSRMCSALLSERGYRSDHGPCHHVGFAVHDLGGDELVPGMVITVEPGAYLRDVGMGCRIEDVVLVTETGCEVLSANVPSHPDAIEELMRAEGIAQRPVGTTGH
jgi:Xaa-Pro aminopeptidase